MRKIFVGIMLLMGSQISLEAIRLGSGSREVVDKIVARVNGQNILMSDLKIPRIDKGGQVYSLEEAIEHEILFQKASERKLLATNLDIEKNIAAYKESSNLTHLNDDELDKRLKSEGLSLDQYRLQLARILATRNLRSLEVSERIVVTNSEVENYHRANPEYSENEYLLRVVEVPYQKAKDEKDAKDKLEKEEWEELDWVKESDLANHVSFVKKMKKEEVSKVVKTDRGYQFIKLADKQKSHRMTLEERWVDIERKIKTHKMEQFEKDYIKELRTKAAIVKL